MDELNSELVALTEKACDRLASRIEDLSDEEYLWEPVPDMWSLRGGDDGNLHAQFGVLVDETPPVTTIAWRLTHIIDLLSEERCATYLGLEAESENLFADGAPATAETSGRLLKQARERWTRYVLAATDLFEKVGPVGFRFADWTRLRFVFHIIDELIHHAAEVGVLRDLYRAEHDKDAVMSVLLSGDRSDAEGLGPEVLAEARTKHPHLVTQAAALGRWDAIPLLIEFGFGIGGKDGRTPLHHAAASGRTDVMRLLIEKGADLSARDPQYGATPAQWAEFLGQPEAAALLRASQS